MYVSRIIINSKCMHDRHDIFSFLWCKLDCMGYFLLTDLLYIFIFNCRKVNMRFTNHLLFHQEVVFIKLVYPRHVIWKCQ